MCRGALEHDEAANGAAPARVQSYSDCRAFVSAITRSPSALASMTPFLARSMMRAAMVFSVLRLTVDMEGLAGLLQRLRHGHGLRLEYGVIVQIAADWHGWPHWLAGAAGRSPSLPSLQSQRRLNSTSGSTDLSFRRVSCQQYDRSALRRALARFAYLAARP